MYSHGGTSVGRQTKDTNMPLAPNDDFYTKVILEGLNPHNMRMTQKVILWGENFSTEVPPIDSAEQVT